MQSCWLDASNRPTFSNISQALISISENSAEGFSKDGRDTDIEEANCFTTNPNKYQMSPDVSIDTTVNPTAFTLNYMDPDEEFSDSIAIIRNSGFGSDSKENSATITGRTSISSLVYMVPDEIAQDICEGICISSMFYYILTIYRITR